MADLFNNFGSKITAVYELVKTFNNSELLHKISDLEVELAKIKSAYAELMMENAELKNQLSGKRGPSIGSIPVTRV
jgi:regulator of replication initiation timing